MRRARCHENLVIVDRDATHGGGSGIGAVVILPDQFTSLGVESLQHHPRIVYVQHTVMHDGCRLVPVAGALLH